MRVDYWESFPKNGLFLIYDYASAPIDILVAPIEVHPAEVVEYFGMKFPTDYPTKEINDIPIQEIDALLLSMYRQLDENHELLEDFLNWQSLDTTEI